MRVLAPIWALMMSDGIHPSETGLPCQGWVNCGEHLTCGPRVWFQGDRSKNVHDERIFAVTLARTPKIIGSTGKLTREDRKRIKAFVTLNRPILMKYWHHKIDTFELFKGLRTIESTDSRDSS